jgi:hypothetical protein
MASRGAIPIRTIQNVAAAAMLAKYEILGAPDVHLMILPEIGELLVFVSGPLHARRTTQARPKDILVISTVIHFWTQTIGTGQSKSWYLQALHALHASHASPRWHEPFRGRVSYSPACPQAPGLATVV